MFINLIVQIVRSSIRFSLLTTVTILLLAPAIIAVALRIYKLQSFIVQLWFSLCLNICGIRVEIAGKPVKGSVLLVSNHASYVDIPVLGSLAPVHFTPKQEISRWPIVGFLTTLSSCIYIDRNSRQAMSKSITKIRKFLNRGEQVSIFPEATTTDGNTVLKFKSGLFAAVEKIAENEPDILVQPISLVYTEINRKPLKLGDKKRDIIAWYKAESLLITHMWRLFAQRNITIRAVYHTAVKWDDFNDRKELAKYCENKVREGLVLTLQK